jgi:hypothetical protein
MSDVCKPSELAVGRMPAKGEDDKEAAALAPDCHTRLDVKYITCY